MSRIKIVLLLGLLVFLMPSVLAISTTPNNINITYTRGEQTPSDITITANCGVNVSCDLSKDGLASSLFTLSKSKVVGTSEQFLIKFQNLNTDTPLGTYSGVYKLNSTEFPVTIKVIEKEVTTGCRIITFGGDYRDSISKLIEPYKKRFNFAISKECGTVTINSIREDGTFTLPGGTQPIAVSGLVPTGEYEGGQSLSYEIEFNVKDLAQGTYDSRIIIESSDENDNDISKVILFQIRVMGAASVTPLTDSLTFPTCTPESNLLLLNQTYKITCSNYVNPDLNVRFIPDLNYFEGVLVDYKDAQNQIIYEFKPVKEGTGQIRISYELKGSPVGASPVFEFQSSISPINPGTAMRFDFFPKLDEAKDRDTLSVLVKDNKTGFILTGVTLFLNGVRMTGNSFMIEQGRSYTLSASLAGYSSQEEVISLQHPDLPLTINPPKPVAGDLVHVSTTANTTLYLKLNGTDVDNPFAVHSPGTYSLGITALGYKNTERIIEVLEKLVIKSTIPPKVKLGDRVTVELNRPAPWSLIYKPDNETTTYPETIYSSTSQVLTIDIPNRKGLYSLFIDGQKVVEWDNRGINTTWIFAGLVVVGLFILIPRIVKPKRSRRFVGLSQPGDNIVETIR